MAQSLMVGALRIHRYVIAGALLGLIVAGLIVFLSRPVYRAETILLPANQEAAQGALAQIAGQFSGLAMMAGLGLDSADTIKESVATLRSRAFTNAFIQDVRAMPVMFESRWDSERGDWRSSSKRPSEWEAYRRFDRKIRRISENKATGVWTLSIDARDPTLAAEWANALVARLNSVMRERAINEADLAVKYLQEELKETDVLELRQSVYRLIEAEIKKGIVARSRTEYAFKVVDPALAPDPRFPVWPKPVLLLALGLVAGSLVGAAVGLWAIRRDPMGSRVAVSLRDNEG